MYIPREVLAGGAIYSSSDPPRRAAGYDRTVPTPDCERALADISDCFRLGQLSRHERTLGRDIVAHDLRRVEARAGAREFELH